jgi:hypothetical protein
LESEDTFWYKIAIITLYTNIKVNSKGMFKSNLYFLLALTKYFLFTSNTDKIFPLHIFDFHAVDYISTKDYVLILCKWEFTNVKYQEEI